MQEIPSSIIRGYKIITLFPKIVEVFVSTSILGKAIESKKIHVEVIDLMKFASMCGQRADRKAYGGGSDLILSYTPLKEAIVYARSTMPDAKVIYPTAAGHVLNREKCWDLSKHNLIIICGRYGGIDERIVEKFVDYEICIGDYILSGGEIPSMIIVESTVRLQEGFLHNKESIKGESFEHNLLSHPQYTRPSIVDNMKVPDVLLSGHHLNILNWKKFISMQRTKKRRPELFKKHGNQDR